MSTGSDSTPNPAATTPAATTPEVEKIRAIIEEIRPYLQRDGGDCEFVSYEDRIVNMRLHGACGTCPSSLMTLRMGIENAIREQVPEVQMVRNVDQPETTAMPGYTPFGHGA